MTITPQRPTRDERIAHLFLTGYSLDAISERGPSAGWTRQDARRVADLNGWTLDASGRIPRELRNTPTQQPAGPPRPAVHAPQPAIALPAWAATLIEGRKHPVPRIKKLADRIDEQLQKLAAAMSAADEERKVRERLAELEAERDRLRARIGKKPRPAADVFTPRHPTDPADRPPINHGSWGGFLAESARDLGHCDACIAAKDDVMAKRAEKRATA